MKALIDQSNKHLFENDEAAIPKLPSLKALSRELVLKVPSIYDARWMKVHTFSYTLCYRLMMKKWKHIKRRLLQWQGVWRDMSVFEKQDFIYKRYKHESKVRVKDLMVINDTPLVCVLKSSLAVIILDVHICSMRDKILHTG